MFQLNDREQALLLKIARDAVLSYLSGRAPSYPPITDGPLTGSYGVFVSLHEKSELRGCIGNVHSTKPLYRSVAEAAVSAAVGDPRFTPLTVLEMPRVDFEISVLSPMTKVDDVASVEVGRDGLMISRGGARGLLLPQVASSYGWDRERFLAETCRKAGLKPGAWKDGDTTIFRFTAYVFGEGKLSTK